MTTNSTNFSGMVQIFSEFSLHPSLDYKTC